MRPFLTFLLGLLAGWLLLVWSGRLPKATAQTGWQTVQLSNGGVKPACTAVTRGSLWFSPIAAAGQADMLEICRKVPGGSFQWATILVQ